MAKKKARKAPKRKAKVKSTKRSRKAAPSERRATRMVSQHERFGKPQG